MNPPGWLGLLCAQGAQLFSSEKGSAGHFLEFLGKSCREKVEAHLEVSTLPLAVPSTVQVEQKRLHN